MRRMIIESKGIFRDAEKIAIQANYEDNSRKKRDLVAKAKEEAVDIIQRYLDREGIEDPGEMFDVIDDLKKYTSSPIILSAIERYKNTLRHSIRIRRF